MVKQFRYTAEYPHVFSDLSYGDQATVAHQAHRLDTDESNAREPEDGATIVLYPGDHLILADDHPILHREEEDGTPIPFEHAWLEPADAPKDSGPTVAELREQLHELGVKPKGTKKADLAVQLEVALQAAAQRPEGEQVNPPAPGEPGSPQSPEGDTRDPSGNSENPAGAVPAANPESEED